MGPVARVRGIVALVDVAHYELVPAAPNETRNAQTHCRIGLHLTDRGSQMTGVQMAEHAGRDELRTSSKTDAFAGMKEHNTYFVAASIVQRGIFKEVDMRARGARAPE